MTVQHKSLFIYASAYVATLTFGRESAQFKQLITYLAILSVVLWVLVLLSTIVRWGSQIIYRQRKVTKPVAEKVQA